MIKIAREIISTFFLIIIALTLVIGSFNLDVKALKINKNDQLIDRIAKDFSKKFCNGIGFGLSQESAMNFALKENMAIFKKKGVENIDKKLIAEKMVIEVIDKCGYSLNLSNNEWESSFEKAALN